MVTNPYDSRPRGFLSDADRDFLQDPEGFAEEHSRPAVNKRRRDLRERVRNALLDFSLLFEELSEDEREEIFDVKGHEMYQLQSGMIAAAAFFYEMHELEGWDFGDFLSRVVEQMWDNHEREPFGKILTEDISWNPELEDRRQEERVFVTAKEKFKSGQQLTDRELGVLVKWGGLLVDNNLDVLRERLEEQQEERSRERWIDRAARNSRLYDGPPVPVSEGEDNDGEEEEIQ